MPGRGLSPDERALWRRVVADVTPLRPALPAPPPAEGPPPATAPTPAPPKFVKPRKLPPAPAQPAPPPPAPRPKGNTLDASWDRRLARGVVAPDRVIDLHGHTLATAHATLDAMLDQAVAMGDRVLLVVAGKDRPGPGRGAIRREVSHWLAASRHASRIAAIRGAHPRHGGGGAFYLILRRAREEA